MALIVIGFVMFAVFAVAVTWACCAAAGDDETGEERKQHEADMLRDAMEEEEW